MLSFTQKLGEAMLRIGRPPMSDGMQEAMLMRAGFVDIHSFTLKMVMGPWPKDAVSALSDDRGERGRGREGAGLMMRHAYAEDEEDWNNELGAERVCVSSLQYSHFPSPPLFLPADKKKAWPP